MRDYFVVCFYLHDNRQNMGMCDDVFFRDV